MKEKRMDQWVWLSGNKVGNFYSAKGSRPPERIYSGPENYTKADDFSDLLWSSQSSGGKSRQIGWNTIEAPRFATTRGNFRIPIECPIGDHFKSDFTAREFVDSDLSGKSQ